MTLNGVMALFCVISANSGSFRANCVKVHVRYLISWWVLVMLYRGKSNSPRVPERSLRRGVTSATSTHRQDTGVTTCTCRHLNSSRHSLYVTRWGTCSQCRSSCRNRFRPRSNFRVPLMTRAAAFMLHNSWLSSRISRPTEGLEDYIFDQL